MLALGIGIFAGRVTLTFPPPHLYFLTYVEVSFIYVCIGQSEDNRNTWWCTDLNGGPVGVTTNLKEPIALKN